MNHALLFSIMKIKAIIRGYVAIELKTANIKYNELKTMLVYKEEIEFEADETFGIRQLMNLRNLEEEKFNAWLYSNSRSVKDVEFEKYNSIKNGFTFSGASMEVNNSEDSWFIGFPKPLRKLLPSVKVLEKTTKKLKLS